MFLSAKLSKTSEQFIDLNYLEKIDIVQWIETKRNSHKVSLRSVYVT